MLWAEFMQTRQAPPFAVRAWTFLSLKQYRPPSSSPASASRCSTRTGFSYRQFLILTSLFKLLPIAFTRSAMARAHAPTARRHARLAASLALAASLSLVAAAPADNTIEIVGDSGVR